MTCQKHEIQQQSWLLAAAPTESYSWVTSFLQAYLASSLLIPVCLLTLRGGKDCMCYSYSATHTQRREREERHTHVCTHRHTHPHREIQPYACIHTQKEIHMHTCTHTHIQEYRMKEVVTGISYYVLRKMLPPNKVWCGKLGIWKVWTLPLCVSGIYRGYKAITFIINPWTELDIEVHTSNVRPLKVKTGGSGT